MRFYTLVSALVGGLITHTAAIPLAEDVMPLKRNIPPTHVLHERHLPPVARKWSKKARLPAEAMLPMRIGLKQSNLQLGHDKLMDQ